MQEIVFLDVEVNYMQQVNPTNKQAFTEMEEQYINAEANKYIKRIMVDNEIKRRVIEGIREKKESKPS